MRPATIAGWSAFGGSLLAALMFGGDIVTATATATVAAIVAVVIVAVVTMPHESRLARRIRQGK